MDAHYRLDGKTAVVTGSGRGIGKAVALTLAKAGANVAVNDVNAADARQTVEEIRALGVQSREFIADITDTAAVNGMFKEITDGHESVDILVNNAGITKDGLIMRMKDDQWDAVLNINLKGAFLCLRACSKIMSKQRSGSIINVSSVIGVMGNAGQANYAASKAGLIGVTKSAAKELAARNVRVNAIAPGFIETAMTKAVREDIQQQYLDAIPMKRYGSPEEVGALILFLASDASSYITGQVINIDGGLVM